MSDRQYNKHYCQVQLNMWPEAGAEISTRTSHVCKHFLNPAEKKHEDNDKHWRVNAGIDWYNGSSDDLGSMDQKDILKQLLHCRHKNQAVPTTQRDAHVVCETSLFQPQ